MTTKNEMTALIGKEILLRSTAFGGDEYFYYVGIPSSVSADEVYFHEFYFLFDSYFELFHAF